MTYVIADIHGCYEEFLALLETIHFRDEDELYLLGDLVDRGPASMALLLDVMDRVNVFPILGNHDYMALTVLQKLDVAVTDESIAQSLTAETLEEYLRWTSDGGASTVRQYRALPSEQRQAVLDYLEECSACEELFRGGKWFVLVHAGIRNPDSGTPLYQRHFSDFLFTRPDYSRPAIPGATLVTGHTPTFTLRPDGQSLVYAPPGHLALDCGCVYGGALAAVCLETGACFYEPSHQHAE